RLLALRDERSRQNAAMLWWGGALLVALIAIAISILLFRRHLPLQRLQSAWAALAAALRSTQVASDRDPAAQPTKAEPASPPPTVNAPRDTAGAIAALELALAYIEEVRDADRPALDDVLGRKHLLNTLALAAKQLELARKLDPDAILEATT